MGINQRKDRIAEVFHVIRRVKPAAGEDEERHILSGGLAGKT
jgi:hypothetical protein